MLLTDDALGTVVVATLKTLAQGSVLIVIDASITVLLFILIVDPITALKTT